MNESKNNLSIPSAIIIAGLIIAFGIYFSGRPVSTPVQKTNNNTDIVLKSVVKTDHIRGNPDAPVLLVEFSDTECPYCKMFDVTMGKIMDTYGKEGKVAWVYRHFPIDSLHSKAKKEAEASECVNELGGETAFWKFIDIIYAETPANNGLDPAKLPDFAKRSGVDVTKFNTCLASGKYTSFIDESVASAIDAGASGTPYTVMVLKNALNSEAVKSINTYVATNKIYDQNGNSLINVMKDNKHVTISGALYLEMMNALIDIVLK